MRKIKETPETACMRQNLLKEQLELAEAKVEIAKGGLIGMFVGVIMLTVVLVAMAVLL